MKSLIIAILLGLTVPALAQDIRGTYHEQDEWRHRQQIQRQRDEMEELRRRQIEQQREIEEQRRRLDSMRRESPNRSLGRGLGTVGR